jgi:DNA-binding transcriptional ArsR family regulator
MLLAEHGELGVGPLSRHAGLPMGRVMYHLMCLKGAGLVEVDRAKHYTPNLPLAKCRVSAGVEVTPDLLRIAADATVTISRFMTEAA